MAEGDVRDITFSCAVQASDGDIEAAEVTLIVTRPVRIHDFALDDAIPVAGNGAPGAQDDHPATGPGRLSHINGFDDDGSGADLDPDGDRRRVVEISGDADLVGEAVTGGTGCRWRLDEDGRFWIDARDGFDDPGAGESRDLEFDDTVADRIGRRSAAHATLHVDGDLRV